MGTRPSIFAVFVIWTALLASELGLLVMMFLDPIWGLGAIILTVAAWLAIMFGWLPVPKVPRRRSEK